MYIYTYTRSRIRPFLLLLLRLRGVVLGCSPPPRFTAHFPPFIPWCCLMPPGVDPCFWRWRAALAGTSATYRQKMLALSKAARLSHTPPFSPPPSLCTEQERMYASSSSSLRFLILSHCTTVFYLISEGFPPHSFACVPYALVGAETQLPRTPPPPPTPNSTRDMGADDDTQGMSFDYTCDDQCSGRVACSLTRRCFFAAPPPSSVSTTGAGRLPPRHCLHWLLIRWCGQMLEPPHSLHWLFWR
jgi:hypothetical protein